jgi:hypothetical protein
MKDAVAYMDWKRVVPWKILSIKARPEKPLVPVGFGARSKLSNSEFFETNCAQPVLTEHNVSFAQNRTIVYQEEALQNSFRACMNQGRETVFLSYRWEVGRRFAFSLAKEFLRSGLSPWFDAMAMPQYMIKGDPGVNKERLKTLLQRGIAKSRFAVVSGQRMNKGRHE